MMSISRFPDFEQLNQAQRAFCIQDLEENPQGATVVEGGPGTGKSVVALHRARFILETEPESHVLLVMHNKTLKSYMQTLRDAMANGVQNPDRFEVKTWEQWVTGWLSTRPEAPYNDPFIFKYPEVLSWNHRYPWEEIREKVRCWDDWSRRAWGHVIIDEGQDLPNGLYRLIRWMLRYGHCPSVTVSADENQAMKHDHSLVSEICTILKCESDVDGREHHRLVQNYRNTMQIARASLHFKPEASDDGPVLPERSGDQVRVRRVTGEGNAATLVVNYARSRPGQSIGVFFDTIDELESVRAIVTPLIDHVQYYHTRVVGTVNQKKHTDALAESLQFGEGWTTLLCDQSTKGLEFDAVFVFAFENRDVREVTDLKKLYVISSRARDHLEYLLTCGACSSYRELVDQLPSEAEEWMEWL